MSLTADGTCVKLNDGHLMPLLGLGTWQAPKEGLFSADGQDKTAEAVAAALTAGYRLIDTAYSYFNEEGVGKGIKMWMEATGGKRSEIFITTKLPFVALHPSRVEVFLKKSLKNLGLEYVDLYLVHLPIGLQYIDDLEMFPTTPDGLMKLDYGTDHIAIWKEMVSMQKKGLAKSIGVSNFNIKQLRRLLAQDTVPPSVNQVEMHLEFQQPAMRRFCKEVGVALTAYANFGSPGRKDTYAGIGTEIPSLFDNPVIQLVADNHKVQTSQVLLRYWVQQGVAVVPKSVTHSRVLLNGKILDWSLSDVEMKALALLDRGEPGRTFRFFKLNGMETHPECPAPVEE